MHHSATPIPIEILITVLSLDWNVSREISAHTGTAMDRESSSTRLGDVTITKLQDKASPDLFKEATIGKGLPAVFHITKQGDRALVTLHPERATHIHTYTHTHIHT